MNGTGLGRKYEMAHVMCIFFQAGAGIRDRDVTGVQTCALPICVMRMGPFWFSALKFDVKTLNSWTKSELGLTGVSQLHPGSETCAPSCVMSNEFTGRPL